MSPVKNFRIRLDRFERRRFFVPLRPSFRGAARTARTWLRAVAAATRFAAALSGFQKSRARWGYSAEPMLKSAEGFGRLRR